MNVILTQPVDIALRTLGEDDQRRVTSWFNRLQNWESDESVRKQSHKLIPTEDVYVLKNGTDIRVFFRLEEDAIVVLDIARKATIVKFGHDAGHGRS